MKIFVVGAQGRMGRELRKEIKKRKKLQWSGGYGRKAQGLIVDQFSAIKTKPSVVIDFSSPELFVKALEWCQTMKVPFLSGTTGLSKKQYQALHRAAKKIPVLWTANTSVGIQMTKEILKTLPLPAAFQVRMTEWHHIHKKDKPSGTALVLQGLLDQKRKNLPAPRSIREGEIVGTHRIEVFSKEEVITIEHKALRRAVFAKGAVDVAEWLYRQKPGVYTMEDYVLKTSAK